MIDNRKINKPYYGKEVLDMTRYFYDHDSAYEWIERMLDKFEHYEVRSTDNGIEARVF